jgi:hypothetical protein
VGIVKLPQNTFSRGELDPRLASRFDTKLYSEGCLRARNISPKPTGGFRRRPGTRFIADLTETEGKVRLIDFVASEEFQYLFLFKDQALDVYNPDGDLIAQATGCAWTEAMLPSLYWSANLNTMIVTCEDMAPQKIVRTGTDTFTVSEVAWEVGLNNQVYAPQYKHAGSAMTIKPSATSGSITLTTSAAWWQSGHVNQVIFIANKAAKITSISSSTVANATVLDTLSSTDATTSWTEEAFNSMFGFPICCCFHEQRLIFGGHKAVPDGLWASKPNAPYNHNLGTAQDNDAIAITLGSESRNQIRAMASSRHLHVGTDSGVFYGPTLDSKGLTPTNVGFRRQVPFGVPRNIKMRIFDGATLFVQTDSSVIREFLYQYTEDAYTGDSVSLFSQHLVKNPVDLCCVFGGAYAPDYYAAVLNSDGTIAQYQSIRSQEVSGWAPWSTNGEFVKICAVESMLFALVKRSIGGENKYYLERFEWDPEWTLDCGIAGEGETATKNWGGADHLVGEEVHAVSGKLYLGSSTVGDDGSFSVNTEVSKLMVGLNFDPVVETMPADAETPAGPASGDMRHIVRAITILKDTLSLAVGGERMLVRRVNEDLSQDPTPVNGRREFWQRGWSPEPTVVITQPEPLQMEVLGLITELEV